MQSYEEFKAEAIRDNPRLVHTTDVFIRRMYEEKHRVQAAPVSAPAFGAAQTSDPLPRGGLTPHFAALSAYASIVAAVGWVVVALGTLALFFAFGAVAKVGGMAAITLGMDALLTGVLGLGMVASGQMMRCFVAIEYNTRATWDLLSHEQQRVV